MVQQDEIKEILSFLQDIAANNNRPWFMANKTRYDVCKENFEAIVAQLLIRVGEFDDTVRHLQVKDCTYRFYRDLRFSQDKSPYKRHFGAYLCARGRKSLHGGYYIHLQPGNCMLAGGCWYLPTKILNVVRQTIVDNAEDFEKIVEAPDFKALFPTITFDPLKMLPHGFSKDFGHPEWLMCRNYCVCDNVPDKFFLQKGWMDETVRRFRLMKPFQDFINDTVDDYI